MTKGSGRCLCGAVRYKFDPDAVLWTGYCHCADCRRATGAPVTAYFGVRGTAWRWLGDDPAVHAFGPGTERFFCPRCGTPLARRSPRWPEEMHGLTGTLDEPEILPPKAHYNTAEQLGWLEIADDLPRHPGSD